MRRQLDRGEVIGLERKTIEDRTPQLSQQTTLRSL